MTSAKISQRLQDLKDHYDLVIVGGGIHGAALIWEASKRGIDAVLFEKDDFASGTSANSLKIIHGGIRYLQSMDIPRLLQSVEERTECLRIAPHLVHPMSCVLPTYTNLTKSKFALNIGIRLYEFLSKNRNKNLPSYSWIPPGKVLCKKAAQQIVPKMDLQGLTGLANWYDAQVSNTERMVWCFIKAAMNNGSAAYNYCEVNEFIKSEHSYNGIIIKDKLTQRSYSIRSKQIVNCTGPWAMHHKAYQPNIDNKSDLLPLTKAINIVVKKKLSDIAVAFKIASTENVDDEGISGYLFATPWHEGSIIGTWYFQDNTYPDDLSVDKERVEKLLSQVNSVLKGDKLCIEDVTLIHAGLLPLKRKKGHSASYGLALASQFRVVSSESLEGVQGMHWVTGVKYTTARHVAEQVLRLKPLRTLCKPKQNLPFNQHILGGDIGDFDDFVNQLLSQYGEKFDRKTLQRLASNYGTLTKEILELENQDNSSDPFIPGTTKALKAEIQYILNNESAYTLSDILLRRTDIGSFMLPSAQTIDYVLNELVDYYQLDDLSREEYLKAFLEHYPTWARKQHKIPVSKIDKR